MEDSAMLWSNMSVMFVRRAVCKSLLLGGGRDDNNLPPPFFFFVLS